MAAPDTEPDTAPAEMVGWLGAVQVPQYGSAAWSLGQRSAYLS